MSGPNTTGLPRTEDLLVGKGRVYIAELAADGTLLDGSWRDVGNAPAFAMNVTTEELEHRSSREGLRTIDKTVTIAKDLAISFALDELDFYNLRDWLGGDVILAPAITNPAIAGITEKVAYITSVKLGVWYDIQNTATVLDVGVRAYDIDSADLTLEKDDVADVLLVEDTDYILDLKFGRFLLKSDATNIAAGDDLNLTLAADAAATANISEVRALKNSDKEYAVRFISVNPVTNDREAEYLFKKVRLTSEGDANLIGEDWAQIGFTGKCAKNEALEGTTASPYLTIREFSNA